MMNFDGFDDDDDDDDDDDENDDKYPSKLIRPGKLFEFATKENPE